MSTLRRNPYGVIKLSGAVHKQLHFETPPFLRLSRPTSLRFEQLARTAVFTCPRDILTTMVTISEYLAEELSANTPDSIEDIEALEHNAQAARVQMSWLDARAPRWGGDLDFTRRSNRVLGSAVVVR